jgi:FtsZ-interacting cell division protein ZipA
MTSQSLIIVGVIVLVVIVVGVWAYLRGQRSRALRQHFGSEYDRTVQQSGERRTGEIALEEREKRVESLKVRPLSEAERARFSEEWRLLQARFVDDPAGATDQADRIIGTVMEERGYPVSDFEQRAADVSVEHADVVTNYRAAHAIALRARKGEATTDELRAALIHYRALFQELVDSTPTQQTEVR